MIAVLFEVLPLPGKAERYFDIAASLTDELHAIDGFVAIERFQSLTRSGQFLSLSWWRDEASVACWRNEAHHRLGQREGRDVVFADYRIRVVEVLRDYGQRDRAQAPTDSRAVFS